MVDTGPPGRASRKVPPLAYIIVALVVIVVAIAVFGPNRTLTTPSGSTVDAQVPENSAMTTTGGGTTAAAASDNGASAMAESQSPAAPGISK